ncbi:hypothetical protein K469DRAFT_626955 [Zopfia rhizophila CBS 207.26]|uniref:tRNA/rRNA methyltransferase SpoU type domain-containing protein n=1 Tax=Zopfia rhizophila CBS 207.26 TaxID=1314779 RepID=A0A6A6EAS7_9PEZI|nr:hypothetical protein K469DRAFT_626955 [Zopfia rhizophila CBS 207.26]
MFLSPLPNVELQPSATMAAASITSSSYAHLSSSTKADIVSRWFAELESRAFESIDLSDLQKGIPILLAIEGESVRPRPGLEKIILQDIEKGGSDLGRLCQFAELYLSYPELGRTIFRSIEERLFCATWKLVLSSSESEYSVSARDFLVRYYPKPDDNISDKHMEGIEKDDPFLDHLILMSKRYINFLKCSFWIPSERSHYLSKRLITTLLALLGHNRGLNVASHDALSALLALLRASTVMLSESGSQSPTCLVSGTDIQQSFSEQLWIRLNDLLEPSRSSTSGETFKLWFQWVHQTGNGGPNPAAFCEPIYWSMLHAGLLAGFPEQQKYCLGILQQSLSLAQRTIDTPHMSLDIDQRQMYRLQYERYCSLFEIIVLSRYPNQVEDCLPELSKLLGSSSLIHSAWTTVLLSAVLNPNVQDGVRKIIGMWYMQYVIEEHGSLVGQHEFLVQGFLPWGTQGTLFTSSLTSSRRNTYCTYGSALTNIIGKFVSRMPTILDQCRLVREILRFIVDRRGKIYAYSILYLLEGLLKGLKMRSSLKHLQVDDLELILQVSRLTGFPEVAKDLRTAYCAAFFEEASNVLDSYTVPGQDLLMLKWSELKGPGRSGPDVLNLDQFVTQLTITDSHPLQNFLNNLQESKHKLIQGAALVSACDYVTNILDVSKPSSVPCDALCTVLDSIWDEADTQEYPRVVTIKLPLLFFHLTCVQICINHHSGNAEANVDEPLTRLLVNVMEKMHRFAETRSYLLPVLTCSIRRAFLLNPQVIKVLPVEEFVVRFVEYPLSPKKEFLHEVVAAEKLQEYVLHRTYASYYGKREWHAYASIIDLLNRFPESQLDVAKRVLRRFINPWKAQKAPVPIISKWKEAFQLQAMLVLTESCISESDAEWYLDCFLHILFVEPWPRYRYLLEWIIARIYYRYPRYTNQILPNLASAEDVNPRLIASLMKLAVMVASFLNSDDFALQLMVQLIPFSASPKVQVRHEAHWSFPIVWDLAKQNGWSIILENPAFKALNDHIRGLDRFNAPATSSRVLKLDIIHDHTITNIFEGEYMRVDQPDHELVAHEDFKQLWAEDEFEAPPARISLGTPRPKAIIPQSKSKAATTPEPTESTSAPIQTKSSFNLSSLLPSSKSPASKQRKAAPLVLVASLIDNPTNLGGLSRISESFGLESLYMRSLDVLNSKDFQSTAVTSHKHFPIRELKVDAVPEFLIDMKRQGYTVVAVEQTDRSAVLGHDTEDGKAGRGVGMLPKRCALVLGSEREGVSKEVLAAVDRCVEIRTVGVTRSLNVQTAGGIAVYEWWRAWGRDL